MKKEEHFIKGVNPNNPDNFDRYEDAVDGKNKKEVADLSPSIEDTIDNKKEIAEDVESEYKGPEADSYRELTDEEIAERYQEYNIEPDTKGLRDAIGKAYEQHDAEEFRKHESMNQHYKDRTWSDIPFQTRDIDQTVYGGVAGKDNLKTIPENKKQRGFRGLLRRLFKTEPERSEYNYSYLMGQDIPSDTELEQEADEKITKEITKGVMTKEELKKEISNEDQTA